MKKEGLVLLFLSISFVFLAIFLAERVNGAEAHDFRKHCSSSGCYIYSCNYPNGPPLDILSQIGGSQSGMCRVSFFCQEDVLKKRVSSNWLGSGLDSQCYSAVISSCVYVVETCEYGCINVDRGNSYCEDAPEPVELSCEDYFEEGVCGSGLEDGLGGFLDCVEDELPQNTKCVDGVLSCINEDYANCDSDLLSGCLDLMSDSSHCGDCDIACDDDLPCINGACGIQNYWTNLVGKKITFAYLNDFVRIVSYDEGPFDIKEGDEIITDIDSKTWQANRPSSEGYNAVSQHFEVEEDDLLVVSENVNPKKEPMNLSILNPMCGMYFEKGRLENITIDASSENLIIYGNVSVDGEKVGEFDNLESNVINISHSFLNSGNSQIIVDAQSSDGERQRVISNIMIYDPEGEDNQEYLAACIDGPKNFQRFSSSTVFFNASSSRGLKYSPGVNVGDDGSFEIILPERLHFHWTFYNSATDSWLNECEGQGTQSCQDDEEGSVYEFYRDFARVNNNHAYLTISM
jgi:hypothetical protein